MVKKYIGLHVKYRYSCPILMKLESSRQIFETSSNVKFHENPSIGSRVFPYGRTDMSKLIDAFRSSTKQPKMSENPSSVYILLFLSVCVISGCRRKVAENCALLAYDAASSSNFLPTFRYNLLVPFSEFKNPKDSLQPQYRVFIGKSVGRHHTTETPHCPHSSIHRFRFGATSLLLDS